jgi:hypothetical protein
VRSGTQFTIVITCQAQRAGFPLTLRLPEETGLMEWAWVEVSQMRPVSGERPGKE